MAGPSEKLNESDHVGHFLVELFHNGHFTFNFDEQIPKRIVRQEFRNYIKKNNLCDYPEFQDKVGTILRKNDYLLHTDKNSDKFKIKTIKFSNFYANLIRELDEKQIKNSFIISENEYISISTTENKENPSSSSCINVNDDETTVLYQGGDTQINISDNRSPITNMGCFICQKNFSNDEEYESHIEYHGEGSGFESVRYYSVQNFNKNPDIKLTYRTCKNSYLLYFTMTTNRKDIIIEKIIIVRSRWMDYARDGHVPFEISKDGIDNFVVDRHSFQLQRPQPIVLIYTYKNQSSVRNVAQYLFLRNEEFPNVKMKLKSTRVVSKDEMKKLSKLGSYYPSTSFKNLCGDNDNIDCNALAELCPEMKDYLQYTKELTIYTIIDVFRILLHIEDVQICNKYKKLNRNNCTIKGYCDEYSVGIKNLRPDTIIGDTLKPFDEIVLTSYENDNNNGNDNGRDSNKQHHNHHNKNSRNKSTNIICYVYRTSNKEVFFTPRNKQKISLNKLYNISFSPGRIPIIYQFRALDILSKSENIRRILFPIKNSNNNENYPAHLKLDFYNDKIKINPEQEQAVMNIVYGSFKSIPYIIFGPPGTGKTTTIIESIYQLWKNDVNTRILVTAGSNAACDEVAQKLCKIFNDVDEEGLNLLRIYAAAVEKRIDNMDENLIEASNLCHNSHFYPSIDSICSYRVIIATLTIVGKLVHGKISENFFTHVFIDECAASTEPEALVGIAGIVSSNTKLILSGDPKQLGPILESNKAAEMGLNLSLIERLMKRSCYYVDPITGDYDRTIQTRLIRNFRTHEKILLLSNSLYYESTLVPCAKQEITDWALGWHRLPSKNFPIVFNVAYGRTERANDSKSLCNYKELSVTLDYVKNLMYFGVNGRKLTENDIGIISPYKKQCNLIRDELDKRKWYKIETGSVETFQGKEKPVIIISMVRSYTPNVGFLDNPRRTNVALTRAQALLIIIGNPETLEKIDDWRQVIEYCKENNAFAGAKYPRQQISTNFKVSQSNLSNITSVSKNSSNVKQNVVMHTKENSNRKRSRKRNKNNNQKPSNAIIQTGQDNSDLVSLGSKYEEDIKKWLKETEEFRKKQGIGINDFENMSISEEKNENIFDTIQDDDYDDIIKNTKTHADISKPKISSFETIDKNTKTHTDISKPKVSSFETIDKNTKTHTDISKPKVSSFETIKNNDNLIDLDSDNINIQPLPNVSGQRISPFEMIHDNESTTIKDTFLDNLEYHNKDNTQSGQRTDTFEIIHDNNLTAKGAFQKNVNSNNFDYDLLDLDRENSFQLSKISEQKSNPFELIHDDIESKSMLPTNVISKKDYLTDPSTLVPVSKIDYNKNINADIKNSKLTTSTFNKDIDSKKLFVDDIKIVNKEITKPHVNNNVVINKNEKEPLKVIDNHRIIEERGIDSRPHHKVRLPDQPIRSSTMIHPFENTYTIIEESDSELVEQSENIVRQKLRETFSHSFSTTPSPKKKDKCLIS